MTSRTRNRPVIENSMTKYSPDGVSNAKTMMIMNMIIRTMSERANSGNDI
jgi:hypothetical protein